MVFHVAADSTKNRPAINPICLSLLEYGEFKYLQPNGLVRQEKWKKCSSILDCRDRPTTSVSIPVRDKGCNFYLVSSTGCRPARCLEVSVAGSGEITKNTTEEVKVITSFWNWRGYNIRYQYAGMDGPAIVLVHGFGANSDHWRKNIPFLAKSHRVFSIDLLGYGYSEKPNPNELGIDSIYTFDTWASQLNDFSTEIVKDKSFYVCNSIGGLVGLQAATMEPAYCKGIVLLNISLRQLHIKNQPWYGKPFIRVFQKLLRDSFLGELFFNAVATPDAVRNILSQCYYDTSKVTDELVQKILNPGLEPGAAQVFLEFISYSDGPLPEELLPQVKCPVLIGWGDKDPWEPIELGKAYGNFNTVEEFVVFPNVGHCPQDEAPELVNPLIQSFVLRHSSK